MTRRNFIASSTVTALSYSRVQGANERLRIGVIGCGSQATGHMRTLVQMLKSGQQGALGKVVLAQIDYSRNYKSDFWRNPPDDDAKPGVNLDWKAWLGPAPKRPFDPDRYFSWRRYWDYSSGIASDLFIHRVTRIIKALDLKFPAFGSGAGGKFEFSSSPAEIPDTLNILLDYPGGPTVQLISSMANSTPVDHLLRGHKATLQFTSTGFTIRPQPGEIGRASCRERV